MIDLCIYKISHFDDPLLMFFDRVADLDLYLENVGSGSKYIFLNFSFNLLLTKVIIKFSYINNIAYYT